MRLGALEAGGTKMVCAIGDELGNIESRASFPTRKPEETMPDIIGFFADQKIEALGVGSFGPLSLDPESSDFGAITTTPKLEWRSFPLRKSLADALNVPVGIDTDVNAAALGEAVYGAGKGLNSLVYYTVGTGIGGRCALRRAAAARAGASGNGAYAVAPGSARSLSKGLLPYHESCLEGLANGPAIEKRWGISAKELPEDHIAWEIEAEYLAQMCVNTIVLLSPKRIVLGGGVMHQAHLFPRIRRRTLELLGGYVAHPAILEKIDTFIVPPALGDNAGAVGSLLLAVNAIQK